MTQLGNEGKVHAYGTLLELESRAREFAGLVLRLKDQVLNRSEITPPEVVASIDDLIWHLRKSAKLLPALERAVGVQRSNVRRGSSIGKSKATEEGLRGTTKSVSVTEVLGLLGSQRKTGTLWLKTDEEVFLLEFSDGAVVHASTNRPLPEQRIGTILVAQNKISQDRLECELAKANIAPIGETMMRAELVSEDDLRDALEHQVQELFHRIYSVQEARFAFRDGAASDLEKRVCLSTTQLLLESARCSDEQARDEQEARSKSGQDVEKCLDWMETDPDAGLVVGAADENEDGAVVAATPSDAGSSDDSSEDTVVDESGEFALDADDQVADEVTDEGAEDPKPAVDTSI